MALHPAICSRAEVNEVICHVARISAGQIDRNPFRRTYPQSARALPAMNKCSAYANVSDTELAEKVYGVYRHLGEWLMGKTEADIEETLSQRSAPSARRKACPPARWCG